MNSSLHLSAIGGHTVAGFEIGGTTDFGNVSVFILYNLVATNDVSTHKTNLAVRLHSEELGRRNFGEIIGIDIELLGERKSSCTCIGISGIVRYLEILNLILGIVGNYNLYGMQNRYFSVSRCIKLFSDAVLEKLIINYTVSLCDTCASYEIEDGRGGVSASAETAERRHTRIVPTVNEPGFNKFSEVTLRHNSVSYVKTCELALLGLCFKSDVINHPLIKRSVVLEFYRAKRVCDTLKCVLDRMRVVVKRINAPLVTLSMMVYVYYSVNGGIAHIDIRRCHINFSTKRLCSVFKLAILHSLKEIEVLLNTSVTVRAVFARNSKSSAILTHLISREIANVCFAVLYKLYGKFVALIEIVRAVVDTAGGLASKPLEILVNAFYIFVILF